MSRRKWKILLFGLLFVATCGLLLPRVQRIRNGEARGYSMNNLKQIAIALHDYHDTYGKLPPAVVRSKDGNALYSWRVAILPFLEETQLYKEFKLDEPWDSPHNKPFLEKMPRIFQTPWFGNDDPPGTTRYQVFVGPNTAFEQPGFQRAKDFPDGLEQTLLAAEAAEPVPWTKPVDLVFDPSGPLPRLGGGLKRTVYFLDWPVGRVPGFNLAFADASVRWFDSDIDEKTLRAMITRNGGENVPP